MRVARLTMQAENGKRLPVLVGALPRGVLAGGGLGALTDRFGARLLPEGDRARNANLGPLDRRVFGAVTTEVKREIGLNGDANLGADIVFELEPQYRLFRALHRNDMERQNHVVAISDRIAAGAVGKSLGRGPQNVNRFHVFRTGEVECRRRSGIAGIAPISLPSRIEPDLDAGTQEGGVLIFARRTRDQACGAV